MRLGASTIGTLGLLIALPMFVHAESPGVVIDADDADKGWRFGIGTGISSFSLDGDIGFARASPAGGVIADVDLDNSDTSDLIDSGFGFAGVATRGPVAILFSYGSITLEDSAAGLDAEWERTKTEIAVNYRFLQAGRHNLGVIAGIRNVEHDWDVVSVDDAAPDIRDVNDDWTDLVLGLTYIVPINAQWAWSNRMDMGFGDTEESFYAATALNWKPLEHWLFNVNLKYTKLEIGDDGDIDDSDFYYYDVAEPSIGIGFMYLW